MKIFFPVIFISLTLWSGNLLATDTTRLKKKIFLSISAGYTNNTVYGSMVKRNNEFGDNVKMEDRGGYMFNASIEKALSNRLFLRSGVGFIQKQVSPMVNTWAVYKDRLKTGYLTVPVELGIHALPDNSGINLAVTLGAYANFKISDKSYSGPDRVDFKTSPFTAGLLAGANVFFRMNPKIKVFFQYTYMHELTNSYVETLYWSSDDPNKKFIYKYKTNALSLGLKWRL